MEITFTKNYCKVYIDIIENINQAYAIKSKRIANSQAKGNIC
jgi:hypothetical protein